MTTKTKTTKSKSGRRSLGYTATFAVKMRPELLEYLYAISELDGTSAQEHTRQLIIRDRARRAAELERLEK